MIAIDSSALMAIVLREAGATACMTALTEEGELLISAGTLAEALIVAGRRGVAEEMAQLVDGLALTVMPVTQACAVRVAAAYARWGRGVHPAGLNFGDCFAYDVARQAGCGLLFVGGDFGRTDVAVVPI